MGNPLEISIEEAAAGIKKIVDTRMADLLRVVTIEQGHDPREFVLYAFGGAGATHAPAFALDIVDEIIVPSSQSVFCALGAVASDIKMSINRSMPKRIARDGKGDVTLEEMESIFNELEAQANEALEQQNVPTDKRHYQREVEVRFIRQTKSMSIPFPGSIEGLINNFLEAYAKRYGKESIPEKAGLEFVTYVIEASGELARPEPARYATEGDDPSPAHQASRPVYDLDSEEFVETPIYNGERLKSGNRLEGPAIIEYEGTTVAISSNQIARIDDLLGMSIRRKS